VDQLETISHAATRYTALKNLFSDFAAVFKELLSDNLLGVSFTDDDDVSFRILCFDRKIRVVFSAFGEVEERYLGKISFALSVPNEEGNEISREIYGVFYDQNGVNYDTLGGPANPARLLEPSGACHVLIAVLEVLLDKINTQMGLRLTFSA